MRWHGRRESDNIEDVRGSRAVRVGIGGGVGTLVLVLLVMYLGGDPTVVLQTLPQSMPDAASSGEPYQETAAEAQLRQFVAVVLADTEDNWTEIFRGLGRSYEEPTLVLFSGAVQSACGFAQSAMGPFYCPANRKLYIDLSFYDDLRNRFGAPGDFAQAYVIAHEVGHHVQTLLGISDRVHRARQRADEETANALSVRLELQADCLAGVWAHHADRMRQLLEEGDIKEGLNAASAIGDDRLQMQSRGYVTPESFTHGSAAQRVRWFRQGIETGSLNTCDTFASTQL
jgi:predicted metalloprotease